MTSVVPVVNFDPKALHMRLPPDFIREVDSALRVTVPEYVRLIDDLGDHMLYSLFETLKHWETNSWIFSRIQSNFRRTKIVEWFAFWKGYRDAGGTFPPSSSQTITLKQGSLAEKTCHSTLFSVIPIGSVTAQIQRIVHHSVSVLQKHPRVSSIVCIYDGTAPMRDLESRYPKVETIAVAERAGPANARNLGMTVGFERGCEGALLLDSDIFLTCAKLNTLLDEYDAKQHAIGCPLVYAMGKTWLDYYHDLAGTLNGRYLDQSTSGSLFFGTTSCMIVSNEIFSSGVRFSLDFPDAAGEDIDFCLNCLRAGFAIAALDNVGISHWYGYDGNCMHDWGSLRSRFERYGRGEYRVAKKHPYYHFLVNRTKERPSRVFARAS
jgi:GT2 family glycosyltransferase